MGNWVKKCPKQCDNSGVAGCLNIIILAFFSHAKFGKTITKYHGQYGHPDVLYSRSGQA